MSKAADRSAVSPDAGYRGFSTTSFRLLLRAYPRSYRRVFGPEMASVFADRCAEVRRCQGRRGLWLLWLRTLPGLLLAAVEARRRERAADRAGLEASPGKRRLAATAPHQSGRMPDAQPPRKKGSIMDRYLQDVRYGARVLAKNPGFTAAAVVTLALGIGANTAIFSLVNALLMRPLPGVEESERLVALFEDYNEGYVGVSSYVNYRDLRERNEVFEDLAVYKPLLMDLSHEGSTERINGMIVTASYFDTLGVVPALGRFFGSEDDDEPDAETVAVLGYGLWQRRFGGTSEVIGGNVILNGRPFTVIGIAPEGFRGTSLESEPQVFAPFMMQPHFMPASGNLLERRGWGGVLVIGRLRDGVTIEQARANVAAFVTWLGEEVASYFQDMEYRIVPLSQGTLMPSIRGDVVRFSRLVMAVVAVVLLIACVNVANLLLARADRRRREIAIRQAVGAGRARLVRQLMIESLLLALLGGTAGLLLAVWSARFLMSLPFPFVLDLSLDARILGFTLGISVITGLLFGTFPALRATRLGSAKQLGAPAAGGRMGGRLRWASALIAGQVALSLILAVAAGLFARSLIRLRTVDPGFDPEGILVATVDPGLQGYEGSRVGTFYDELVRRVRAIPGVEDASLVGQLPGPGNDNSTTFSIEGYEPPDRNPSANYNMAGIGYFRTMRIPLVEGRAFDERDSATAPLVLVVNQTGARYLEQLTGRPALGARLSPDGPEGPFLEVIGVAANTRATGLGVEPPPMVYIPHQQVSAQGAGGRMTVLLRASGDPSALAPFLRSQLEAIDPNVPLFDVDTLEHHLSETLLPERYSATLMGASAVLALTLAMVGLYGVLSYSVSQRTGEVGVRIALGARPADVLAMVVSRGMALVVAGIALGIVGAMAVARLLETFLFGVSGNDAVTYIAVSVGLAAIAAVASYIPARRATKVDPLTALRSE